MSQAYSTFSLDQYAAAGISDYANLPISFGQEFFPYTAKCFSFNAVDVAGICNNTELVGAFNHSKVIGILSTQQG